MDGWIKTDKKEKESARETFLCRSMLYACARSIDRTDELVGKLSFSFLFFIFIDVSVVFNGDMNANISFIPLFTFE